MINHIQVVREAGASYKAQNLFLFLENVDHLQKLQLQVWTDKQKDLEEKRRGCLSSMATMFPKVGLAPGDLLRGQHGQQEQGQDGAMGLWGCAWGQESRWEIREQIKASEPGRGEGRRQPE